MIIILEEKIVMTPKCKTSKSTTFLLERTRVEVDSVGKDGKVHVAGGDHSGIIVNKQITNCKALVLSCI